MSHVRIMFNPSDPHCIVCDGHIDTDEDFVLTGMVNPAGDRIAVVAHVECAMSDNQMMDALTRRMGSAVPQSDYLN
jgi:hypothetical protein